MPFHIIQLDEETGKRTTSGASYATLKEATDQLAKDDADQKGEHGYDAVGGFWWRKDGQGKVTRVYADDTTVSQ
jgi:hypothetical protein